MIPKTPSALSGSTPDDGPKRPYRPPSPEYLRALADAIENADCTGMTASWCPHHGTCVCPRHEDGEPIKDEWEHPDCPLHAPTSKHASPMPEPVDNEEPERV